LVPNGDGTIIDNAALQNDVYSRIDAMFAGAGAYATFTLGGKLAVEGFGTHLFSAGGTGANVLRVRNTTSGTGNSAYLAAGNNSNADLAYLQSFTSGFTSSGPAQANGSYLNCQGAGGFSIGASDAAGVVRFYSGGTTERARFGTDGTFSLSYALTMAGALSPADVGGVNQNNYNPAGLSTAGVLRLTNVGGGAVLSGITAQEAGRVLMLVNLGTSAITLNDEDTNSSAANRFALSGAKILATDDGAIIWYDGTSQRWRIVGAV
jgi:hypothetical protein